MLHGKPKEMQLADHNQCCFAHGLHVHGICRHRAHTCFSDTERDVQAAAQLHSLQTTMALVEQHYQTTGRVTSASNNIAEDFIPNAIAGIVQDALS